MSLAWSAGDSRSFTARNERGPGGTRPASLSGASGAAALESNRVGLRQRPGVRIAARPVSGRCQPDELVAFA
jgi:hypothetical protein